MAALFGSADIAAAFSWNSSRQEQSQQLVKKFQVQHQVPSISVGIVVGGKPVLQTSFNIDGSADPAGVTTRYHIGSVSKQITAAAVLALIEDKTAVPSAGSLLSLDTPLSAIFPSIANVDAGQATVRRLLTMTSGFPSYTDDPMALTAGPRGSAFASRPVGEVDIIRRLRTYSVSGRPTSFDYSNTNYFVLALIADVLTGGYVLSSPPASHKYFHERVLGKAGMASSGFVGEPPPAGTMDAKPTFLRTPLFNQGAWPKGAGDIVSSVSDVMRWNIGMMSGRVLGPGSLATFLAPAAPVTDSAAYGGCSYAMGLYVCERDGYRLFQHDGVISGFMASNAIARSPDGAWMSATVLANSDATIDIVSLVRSLVEAAK